MYNLGGRPLIMWAWQRGGGGHQMLTDAHVREGGVSAMLTWAFLKSMNQFWQFFWPGQWARFNDRAKVNFVVKLLRGKSVNVFFHSKLLLCPSLPMPKANEWGLASWKYNALSEVTVASLNIWFHPSASKCPLLGETTVLQVKYMLK